MSFRVCHGTMEMLKFVNLIEITKLKIDFYLM